MHKSFIIPKAEKSKVITQIRSFKIQFPSPNLLASTLRIRQRGVGLSVLYHLMFLRYTFSSEWRLYQIRNHSFINLSHIHTAEEGSVRNKVIDIQLHMSHYFSLTKHYNTQLNSICLCFRGHIEENCDRTQVQ